MAAFTHSPQLMAEKQAQQSHPERVKKGPHFRPRLMCMKTASLVETRLGVNVLKNQTFK
jgi:hypothetical protein